MQVPQARHADLPGSQCSLGADLSVGLSTDALADLISSPAAFMKTLGKKDDSI